MKVILFIYILNKLFSSIVGGDYTKGIIRGDYLYEISPYGMSVIYIKDPLNPLLIEEIPTRGITIDAAAMEDYLYILDDEEGIIIYSIEENKIKEKYPLKNGTVLLAISPYLYVGTFDGNILTFIQKDDGKIKEVNRIKFKPLPVTLLDIGEKGIYAVFSESLLVYFSVQKGEKLKPKREIVFDQKITKFKVIDTLIIYGLKEGGIYLNSFENFSETSRKLLVPHLVFISIYMYGSKIFLGTEDGKLFIFSYPDFKEEGSIQLIGEVNDMIAVGEVIYVSLGRGGISMLRIPNLEEIKTIGNTGIFLLVEKIDDKLIYVVDRTIGVRFLTFFSSTNPVKDYECEIPGKVVKVLKYKDYFLIGIEEGGIWVTSLKSSFKILGFVVIEGRLKDFILIGDKIFVGYENGVKGYKIKNGEFKLIFEKHHDYPCLNLTQVGDENFIALTSKGIFLYDTTGRILKYEEKILPIAFSKKGDEIYILNISGEIYKYENTLQYLGKIRLPALRFEILGDKAYVIGENILRIYSFPTLKLEKEYKLPEKVYGIKVLYPYIFSYGMDKIFIHNISENLLNLVNTIITDFPISFIDIHSTGVYVGGVNKFEFYNFFNFKNPYELSYYLTPEEIYASSLHENLSILFVAIGSKGLLGIDLENPYSPKEIFHYIPEKGFTYDVVNTKRYVFTANLDGGIGIFEIVGGKKVKMIKIIEENASSIEILKDLFLIAGDREGNLRVYELIGGGFNKIYETKISETAIWGIETIKNYVYLATGKEIICMNFENPQNPKVVKIEKTNYLIYGIKIIKDKIFAFCGKYGFIIYSLKKDGSLNKMEGFVDTPGSTQDICEVGDYYLIADIYSLEVMKK